MELNLKLTCDTCGGNQFVYPEDDLQADSPVTCSGWGRQKFWRASGVQP
jgi:hypothetical protein